jgi:Transposase C of IS166 homeodomain
VGDEAKTCPIRRRWEPTADFLPDDVATLKAIMIATQLACLEAEAKARNSEAEVRVRELLIEKMKFTIAKLRHERFGQSAERSAVLEQLELSLADLEEGSPGRRRPSSEWTWISSAGHAGEPSSLGNRIRRLSKMESTSTKLAIMNGLNSCPTADHHAPSARISVAC